MPKGQQRKIKGAICNVPVDCDQRCNILPERSGIILLKLKRKIQFGGHYYFEAVRPEFIMTALNWLKALMTDRQCEELTFLVLFPNGKFGYTAERDVKLSPVKYFNARLLHYSGRFATNPEYLFFARITVNSPGGDPKSWNGRMVE